MESFNNLCLKWWDGFYSSFQNSCSMTCISDNGTREVDNGEISILMGVGSSETSSFLDFCGIPDVDVIKFNQVLCQMETLCMPKIILMYEQYKSSIHLENKNCSDLIFDSFQIMDERSGQTNLTHSDNSNSQQNDARIGHIRIISANDELYLKPEPPDDKVSNNGIERESSLTTDLMQPKEAGSLPAHGMSPQNIETQGKDREETDLSQKKSGNVNDEIIDQGNEKLRESINSYKISSLGTLNEEELNSKKNPNDPKIDSQSETSVDKPCQNEDKCVSKQIRRSSRQIRVSSRFGEDSQVIKNLIKPDMVRENEYVLRQNTLQCVCSVCKAVFSDAKLLKSHWKAHKESRVKKNKPFFCYKCCTSYCTYLSFKKHQCSKENGELQKTVTDFEKENITFTYATGANDAPPREDGNKKKSWDKEKDKCGLDLDNAESNSTTPSSGLLNCTLCSLSFMTMLSLRNHQKSHGRKTFKCNECGNQFSGRKSLSFHINKVHPKSEQFQCSKCSEIFFDSDSLKRHAQIHTHPKQKTFFCEICGKSFYRQNSLLNHQRLHEGGSEFRCQVCQKSFVDKRSLVNHLSIHTGEKPHVCEICGKRFRLARGLINHGRLHDKSSHLKCDLCPKTFIEKRSFEAHKFAHSGIKPYTCGVCGKTFRRELGLENHSRLHDKSKAIKCDVCGKFFVDKWGMLKHKTIHTGEKPFTCDVCGKSFRIKKGLLNHVKLHDKNSQFKCELCPRTFVEKRKLDIHIRAHRGEKAYVCDQCGQRFMNSMTLKVHKRRHTGEKPYKCSFCEKAFNQQGSLIAHERYHKGEKPYICEVCGDGYVTKSHLTIHRRKHFNDRPYKCEQCDYAAFTYSLLRIHRLKHSSEKPYKCHMCSSAFKRPHHLDVHMRTHLGTEKLFYCQYCNESFASSKKFSSHLASHSHDIYVVTPQQSSTESNILSTEGLGDVAYDIVLIS